MVVDFDDFAQQFRERTAARLLEFEQRLAKAQAELEKSAEQAARDSRRGEHPAAGGAPVGGWDTRPARAGRGPVSSLLSAADAPPPAARGVHGTSRAAAVDGWGAKKSASSSAAPSGAGAGAGAAAGTRQVRSVLRKG